MAFQLIETLKWHTISAGLQSGFKSSDLDVSQQQVKFIELSNKIMNSILIELMFRKINTDIQMITRAQKINQFVCIQINKKFLINHLYKKLCILTFWESKRLNTNIKSV